MLVVANHPNALIDPLILFRTAGRPTRPLAKAPLFEQTLVGTVLKGLGGLPVYRRRDDPDQLHRNQSTFDAAVAALRAGDAVQIYPEGQSHSEPALTPLKTGAARIAFQAEAASGWALGLRIVPIGLTYERKHLFRGRAVATIGGALTLEPYRESYLEDDQETVRALTDDLRVALEKVTLNLESAEDRSLIETAETLYARQKGITQWRERAALSRRLPRLQAFARGVAWLRAHDPAELARLKRTVERYRQMLVLLGAHEGDVPPFFRSRELARYVVRELASLLLLAPFALLATLAWFVPYYVPRVAVRLIRPQHDAIATYKLSSAMLAFPLALAGWCALAWWFGGVRWAMAALVGLPLAGLGWIGWTDRYRRVRDDLRVFLRAAPRKRSRARLMEIRTELVEAFDRIAGTASEPD